MTLDQVDLSIIPCVSCDRLGHRLGQGTGSMTAFLPETPKTPPCSAGEPLRTHIPREPHDVVFPLLTPSSASIARACWTWAAAAPPFGCGHEHCYR